MVSDLTVDRSGWLDIGQQGEFTAESWTSREWITWSQSPMSLTFTRSDKLYRSQKPKAQHRPTALLLRPCTRGLWASFRSDLWCPPEAEQEQKYWMSICLNSFLSKHTQNKLFLNFSSWCCKKQTFLMSATELKFSLLSASHSKRSDVNMWIVLYNHIQHSNS